MGRKKVLPYSIRAQSNHHTRWFLARDADAVLFTPQSYNLPAIASSALPVLRVKVLWANKVVALEEKRVLSVESHKLFIMGGYDGFRVVKHDLLELKDAASLYVAGEPDAQRLVLLCAGSP